MKLQPTSIPGAFIAESTPFVDDRGAFMRLFCNNLLAEALGTRGIRQINHSRTMQVGALRGLHFQHFPHAEMKLVRCLRGRVWDVAVDLRKGSPSFLQWHAEELNPGNAHLFIIPEGCAHGFQVLESDSELLYLHTAPYQLGSEGGIAWDDPRIGIAWPLPPVDISMRDMKHPWLTDNFEGLSP